MSKDLNAVLAGFGGQGVLFLGKAIAYAGLLDEKEVSWMPSYGPEMRGGTANCAVRICEEPVDSPLVGTPNALVVMNLPSYDQFINSVEPGGIAILDSALIHKKVERTDISAYYVPATSLAQEHGLQGLANIILLGKLMRETGFCTMETMEKTIEKIVPPRKAHLIPRNLEAVQLGMQHEG